MKKETSTPNRRRGALPIALAASLLLLTPTLAQESGEAASEAMPAQEQRTELLQHVERSGGLPRGMPRDLSGRLQAFGDGPGGRLAWGGAQHGPARGAFGSGGRSTEDTFARWLQAEPRERAVLPGLVGHLEDGASLRLAFYDGDPAEGGTLLRELSYVAGQDSLDAFQAQVREAAAEASHLRLDVSDRTVALPQAADAAQEETQSEE